MSDEQQPRAEWIFPEEKKSNKGRVWLIVGVIAGVLVIVGVALFLLVPRDETPNVDPTKPATVAPAVPVPDIETFTAQVQPRLDDATRGLDLVAENMDVGAEIVDSLQQDAEVLSGTPAPSSLADQWNAAVTDFARKLSSLRATLDNGSDAQSSLDDSRASLNELRALVGI